MAPGKHEIAIMVTLKDATEEDVLAFIERLAERTKAKITMRSPDTQLMRAFEQPRKAIAEWMAERKRGQEEEYRKRLREALDETGSTYGAAKKLGVSIETVRRWAKRLGLQLPLRRLRE